MKLEDYSSRDLHHEAESLLYRYVSGLDEGELEAWPGFFVEDAGYRIIARENYERNLPLCLWLSESRAMLEDRVIALRKANVYSPRTLRHIVSNPVVLSCEKGEARARSNFLILQTPLDGETRVFVSGKYEDRIVLEGGAFKFREKLCIYDTLRIPNSLIYPL